MTCHFDEFDMDAHAKNVRLMGEWADKLGAASLKLRSIRKHYSNLSPESDPKDGAYCRIVDSIMLVSGVPDLVVNAAIATHALYDSVGAERARLNCFSTIEEYYEDAERRGKEIVDALSELNGIAGLVKPEEPEPDNPEDRE